MDENKNLTPETEEVDTAKAVKPVKETKKAVAPKSGKKIKNQSLLRRGGYSIAITAIVIAAVIVVNILVSALSDRFVLEFDMTAEKKNSISADNIEYIKKIDKDINIIVCAGEEIYTQYVASYTAPKYGVSDTSSSTIEYYQQTVKLINKYATYNDKISVQFIDPQTTEFNSVASTYSTENINFGDIIVERKKANGDTRYKIIGFDDIYALNENEEYAYYGTVVAGNNIETALTGAIAYAMSDKVKQAIVLTGHSSSDPSTSFCDLLTNSNFEVTVNNNSVIEKIDNKYDLIIIPGPTKDFIEKEIKVISDFLDNDGNLGKGMMVFADASAPYLANFYEFLEEWGVEIKDGIVFETYEELHADNDRSTYRTFNTGAIENISDMQMCYTGYNVPMQLAFEKQDYMQVASVMESYGASVIAPKGTKGDWTGGKEDDYDSYSSVIESVKSNYDAKDNEIETYVTVFSSVHFLESEYNEAADVSNKNICLALAERSVGIDEFGISFVPKQITNETFAENVNQGTADWMRIIFMFILPAVVMATGIYIYIRRRNAE